MLLLSRKNVSQCGMLPLQVRKWAKGSKGTSVEDVEKALVELENQRYVFVDYDTEEVLIRSFVRNDGVLKMPNIFKAALSSAVAVESPKLREVLAGELRRVGRDDANRTAQELFPISSETVPEPVANPSGTRENDPEPVDNLLTTTGSRTVPEGFPLPHGVGEGEGVGEPLVGGWVGEAPSRPTPRCSKHINHDDPPPCRGCATAREAGEAWDRRAEERRGDLKAAIERARLDSRQRCGHGTPGGLFVHPDTGKSATCAHCRRPHREAS
ncbi:hypothetical protein [Amycolatopsis japonica]